MDIYIRAIQLLALWIVIVVNALFAAESEEARLISGLLRHYEPRARPLLNSSNPIYLNISMNLMQIIGVDDKKQILAVSGWLNIFWRDENISWVPSEYGGIQYIVLPSTALWLPDIGHTTSIDGQFDLSSESTYKVKVYYDGRVEWYPGGIFQSGCRLRMKFFPFDHQICNMTIESWAYNKHQVMINAMNDVVDLQPSVGNGQWYIEKSAASDMVFLLSELDGYWSKVEIQLLLQRKSGYYVMNIIIPCVAISFLILMVFYLPPDAGEKISLGITVLLAFSVFQLLIADIMPRSSDETPVIVIYLTAFMGMATISIVLAVFSLNVHHKGSELRMPRWVKVIVFQGMARFICARSMVECYTEELKVHPSQDYQRRDTKRGMFLDTLDAIERSAIIHSRGDIAKTSQNSIQNGDGMVETGAAPVLTEILRELRILTGRLRHDDETNAVAEEWRLAARIVDRFLMFIYIVVNCSVTCGCLTFAVLGGNRVADK